MKHVIREGLIGHVVGGYRLGAVLASGPRRVVYQARHVMQPPIATLTLFLLPELVSSALRARFLTRFLQEAAVLMSVRHPNLLSLLAYGEWQGFPYLVTPWIADQGESTLATVVQLPFVCPPGPNDSDK